jgi:hypothetical protein
MFEWFIGLVVVAMLALFIVASWMAASSPTFSLRKDQWECVEYRDYTTFTMAGKVLVPIQHHECQEWRRVQ